MRSKLMMISRELIFPLFLPLVCGCEGKVTSTTPANCRKLSMPTGCPDVFVTKDGERDIYVTDKGGICVVENGKVTTGSPPYPSQKAEEGGK